jgi:hypothetical protein
MEVVLMRLANGVPANRRPLAVLSTMLAIAFVFGGILAATVLGLERLGSWVGTYLIPVAVVLAVIIASLALLTWAIETLPDSPLRDWRQ